MHMLNVIFITHTHERIARSVMSMARQTRTPDAIVVSCDDDSDDIRAEVARAADFIGRRVLLVTRPHTGEARPAQTRNNAVRALAERNALRDDDRLIFFDGDCIAPANVLAIHEHALRHRELSIGWRIDLTDAQTAQLRDGDAGRTFSDIADIHQHNEVRATARTFKRRNLQRMLGLTKLHKPQVLGANFGVVASTFRAVNGLDETYTGWGMEDDDFGRRVYALGGHPALHLHDCVVLHQHHPTRASGAWKDNEQAHRLGKNFAAACEHGLENPLPQPKPRVAEVGPNRTPTPTTPAPTTDGYAPFFVVGTGRCGSTLLQAMLMSHPDIRMPPETQYFSHLDPVGLGCSDPLGSHEIEPYLNHALKERARFFLNAMPGTADEYALAVRAGLRSARDQFLWICERMTRGQSGTRLGEKTPQHWQSIDRINTLFPGARFVHLVRDPRDVTASLLEMDWWESRSARKTAKYWRNATDAAALHQRTQPDRHLTIRYESLIDRPEPVLREICGLLGVEFHPDMLEHRDSAKRSFSPAEEKYKGMTTKPIDQTRVGRYRKRLSPLQVRVVEATVGTQNMHRLGYAPDPQVARPVWSLVEPTLVRAAESINLTPRTAHHNRSKAAR